MRATRAFAARGDRGGVLDRAQAQQAARSRRRCRGRRSRPRPRSCSSTSTSSIATRSRSPTLTPADFELEVNGQPRKIDIGAVHFDDADQHHAGHAARSGLHLERNRDHRTPAAVRRRRGQPARRRQPHRSCARAQSLFERLAPGDLVGLARLPNGIGGVEFTADRKRITDAPDERSPAPPSMRARHGASQHQRSVGAREQRRRHVPERRQPRMQRHDRRGSRSLPQRARSRRPGDAARGQRARPRDAAVARSAAQEPGAAQDAGQHRDDLGGHVRGARSPEHDRARPPRRGSARHHPHHPARRRSSSTSRTRPPSGGRRGSSTTG